jgi:SAM-dependent methyltransferase
MVEGELWGSGEPYEQYVGRWSRRVADGFLDWLSLPPGLRWVDVGCGTGALAEAVLDLGGPASVAGVEPSEGFLDVARRRLGDRAELHAGRADALPLPAASADAVVSGLVLNFVPDPVAALAEMARVARTGGTVAAYVWDYAGRMDMMTAFWAAAREIDPAAAGLDEGTTFVLSTPEALSAAFENAGLHEYEVTGIEIATPFDTFDDYWRPFLGGQGPAPAYAVSLPSDTRARLRNALSSRVSREADGSLRMRARAWAIRAVV